MVKADVEVEKDVQSEPGAGGGSEAEMTRGEANIDNVDKTGRLRAVNAVGEPIWINLHDYVQMEAKKSAKLMPDLDFEKVSLDRKR